jgi:hypothetical protein
MSRHSPGAMIVEAMERVAWNAALCLSDLWPDLSMRWGSMQESSESCTGCALFLIRMRISVTRVRTRSRPPAVSRRERA